MKPTIKALSATALLAAALACSAPSATEARNAGVIVHLFEWTWADVAKECPNLAAKGYEAVQISPPNEHIGGSQWWTRYQPVSYKLHSRGGSRDDLIRMIDACHAAGVKVYADIVINHTADKVVDAEGNTSDPGVGVAGSTYTRKNHPDVPYVDGDYRTDCAINYNDASTIRTCMIGALPDLDTGKGEVQDKIAAHLRDLSGVKVDGFRVDAAKHVSPSDLQAIYTKAGNPYVYQEVIEAAGEPVRASQYTHLGDVLDFTYGAKLSEKFKVNRIADLHSFGKTDWGLVESARAVVFVDNHDRERGHGGGGNLTYRDGSKYNLATVFKLAWPYGYPRVLSSYVWDGHDDAAGPRGPVDCPNAGIMGTNFVCQHQWGNIANMVAYRRNAIDACQGYGDAPVDYWWTQGANKIGFGCMDKGYVVINNDTYDVTATIKTGMSAGTYCNVLSHAEPCSGDMVTVNNNGEMTVTVRGQNALAIHVGARP